MQFELRHVLSRPPDVAFTRLTEEAFEGQMDQRMGLDKTLIERRLTDEGLIRVWKVIERGDKPAFVQKLIGGAFEYTLEHRIERERRRVMWRVTPSMAAERVRAEGFESIEPDEDPQRAVRIVTGVVEVNAPVVGRRLADFIGGEVKNGYERAMPFVERYVLGS